VRKIGIQRNEPEEQKALEEVMNQRYPKACKEKFFRTIPFCDETQEEKDRNKETHVLEKMVDDIVEVPGFEEVHERVQVVQKYKQQAHAQYEGIDSPLLPHNVAQPH
jgi:hypothetical protein